MTTIIVIAVRKTHLFLPTRTEANRLLMMYKSIHLLYCLHCIKNTTQTNVKISTNLTDVDLLSVDNNRRHMRQKVLKLSLAPNFLLNTVELVRAIGARVSSFCCRRFLF